MCKTYKLYPCVLGEHMKPEFLKLNPFHRVPIINDSGMVMSERWVICLFLCVFLLVRISTCASFYKCVFMHVRHFTCASFFICVFLLFYIWFLCYNNSSSCQLLEW